MDYLTVDLTSYDDYVLPYLSLYARTYGGVCAMVFLILFTWISQLNSNIESEQNVL